MLTFQNPILAATTLVRAQVNSPGYVEGSAGWAIKIDGSAEFNNVTIRGGLTENSISLFYSGTPALGNLIASVSPVAGTDIFGNAYEAGVNTYEVISGLTIAVGLNTLGPSGNPGLSLVDVNSPAFIPAGVFGLSSNAGIKAIAVLTSGRVVSGDVQAEVVVQSAEFSGTTDGQIALLSSNLKVGYNSTILLDDNAQVTTVAGAIKATTGVTASPTVISTDTWHAMILTGGWTGNAQYKLMPDNTVMIRTNTGSIGGGTNTNGTAIWTAPPSYVPAAAQQSIPLIVSAVGAGSAAAAISPFLEITSAGVLSVNGISGQNATNLRFCGRYALDS